MSEQKYESNIHCAAADADVIFRALSNFRNLEKVKHLIPQDKVQEIDIEDERVRFKVDGLGQKIGITIVDKTPGEVIKFGAENIPMDANFWIQLKQLEPQKTAIKLTIKADLPMVFKMMLDKKLKEGIEQAAVMLAQMPFNQWNA